MDEISRVIIMVMTIVNEKNDEIKPSYGQFGNDVNANIR